MIEVYRVTVRKGSISVYKVLNDRQRNPVVENMGDFSRKDAWECMGWLAAVIGIAPDEN